MQNPLPSCSQARRDLASPFLWLPQWQIGTECIRRMCVIKAIIVCIYAPNNQDAVGVYCTNYKSKSIKLLQIIFTTCINNAWWQRNVFLGSRDGEASDNNQSTLHSSLSQVFALLLWLPLYCLCFALCALINLISSCRPAAVFCKRALIRLLLARFSAQITIKRTRVQL